MWRPDWWTEPYDTLHEIGADMISEAIKEKLQAILDNNNSDQERVNALVAFIEELGT